jgi:PAS domain S-box-containing protein
LFGHYDFRLVALSIAIAILAAGAALDLAERVRQERGRGWVWVLWLVGGAVAMGTGIWAMHFVGMAAFHLPVPVAYDLAPVGLSLFAAILASGIALFVVGRLIMTPAVVVLGGGLMGAGIVAMHYIGMAAMRLPATVHYSAPWVTLSVGLAIVLSSLALWMTYQAHDFRWLANWHKPVSAVVMGLAIPTMHYSGMAASSFTPANIPVDLSRAVSSSSLGLNGIVTVTILLLGIAIVTSQIDRRLAEHARALQASEARYRHLVEHASDILYRTDAKGIVTYCNPIAVRIMQYAAETLLGRHFLELVHPDSRHAAKRFYDIQYVKKMPTTYYEFPALTKDGQTIWIGQNVQLIMEKNHIVGFQAVARDITARKQTEEELQQVQALKDDLVSLIVHDLRNPLFGIKGNLQLLELGMKGQSRTPDHDTLQQALEATAKLQELVDDILQVRLLEEGQLQLTRVSIAAQTLVAEAIATLEGDAKARRVKIEHHLTEDLKLWIDAKLARRSVENLLANALKYSPQDGTVTLIVQSEPDWARIEVADQGSGIPDDLKNTLFEKFGSVEVQQGGARKGHGLGLYLVKLVMQAHGGSVSVHDRPGGGTIFRLSFPNVSP